MDYRIQTPEQITDDVVNDVEENDAHLKKKSVIISFKLQFFKTCFTYNNQSYGLEEVGF